MLWLGERGALGAPVVPLVNWMLIASVELQLRLQFGQHLTMPVATHAEHVIEAEIAGVSPPPIRIRVESAGTCLARTSRERHPRSRHQFAQHTEIVASLKALGGDQRLTSSLVECVLELIGPIRGIDVDHDEAGLGRRELGDHPLGVVRRPDADAGRPEPSRAPRALRRTRPPAPGALDRSTERSAAARPALGGQASALPTCRNEPRIVSPMRGVLETPCAWLWVSLAIRPPTLADHE